MTVPAFALRPAVEQDRDFIYDCFLATLKRHVEWQRGWDDATERDKFWQHHPLAKLDLIMVDGEPAGCLFVDRLESLYYLRMIMLLPRFQGQGIGSALLQQVIAKADADDLPLQLGVIKSNHAKQLYDRLGFVVVSENDTSWQMQWRP